MQCHLAKLLPTVMVLSACSISNSELHGVYSGSHDGYQETITIEQNGNYSQVLLASSGRKFTASGTWKKMDHRWLELDRALSITKGLMALGHTEPLLVSSVQLYYTGRGLARGDDYHLDRLSTR